VREAVEILIRSATNKLVVVDAGQKLQGIVTVMDLVTAAQRTE
jgi:CBS domain-containing protein